VSVCCVCLCAVVCVCVCGMCVIVNIFASLQQKSDLIFGNILGSNIANTLLILGITGLIYPIHIKNNKIVNEILISIVCLIIVGLLLGIPFQNDYTLSALNGIVLLGALLLFLIWIYKKNGQQKTKYAEPSRSIVRSITLIALGITLLWAGGKLVVDSAIFIAATLGLSEALIALFAVAIGTSLPELATSILAATKKKPDLVFGNIIGSNIFNLLLILGVSSFIFPISFNPKLITEMGVIVVSGLLLIPMILIGKKYVLNRIESGCLLSVYFLYVLFIFQRG